MFKTSRKTREAVEESLGKTIKNIEIKDNLLVFYFNNSKLTIEDVPDCYEEKWMCTDDPLDYFKNTVLLDINVQEGPKEILGIADEKESQFIIVKTSLGEFTIVNYNSHNGYYGGFELLGYIENE